MVNFCEWRTRVHPAWRGPHLDTTVSLFSVFLFRKKKLAQRHSVSYTFRFKSKKHLWVN